MNLWLPLSKNIKTLSGISYLSNKLRGNVQKNDLIENKSNLKTIEEINTDSRKIQSEKKGDRDEEGG